VTLLDLATRFIGELPEKAKGDNNFIQWCHERTTLGEQPDEVPWCSSFLNGLCWILRLPRSKKANARSWLDIGVSPSVPTPGYDIVILERGPVNSLQGHVGVFAGFEDNGETVLIIGGNQSNNVTLARFPQNKVLGIRRLKIDNNQ